MSAFLLALMLAQSPPPAITITNMVDGGSFRNDTLRLLVSAPNAARMELWLVDPPVIPVMTQTLTATVGRPIALVAEVDGMKLIAYKQTALIALPSSYVPLEWGERSIPVGTYIMRVVACTALGTCAEKLITVKRVK